MVHKHKRERYDMITHIAERILSLPQPLRIIIGIIGIIGLVVTI